MKRGTKLITVDPRLTWLAAQSDYWLQIRPGTDAAMAIAWLKTILDENLYSHEFVEKWTHGFDKLKAAMDEYSFEELAETTWCDLEKIKKAARMYAAANNGAFQLGVAIDMQRTGVACAQALSDMMAICDNLDQPGGNIFAPPPFGIPHPGVGGWGVEKYSVEYREKTVIGAEKWPLMKLGMLVDHPDDFAETLITEQPYKMHGGWMAGENPLPCMATDPYKWQKGLLKNDYNVCVDLWMTPSAMELCDLVLPVATFAEKDSIRCCLYNLATINKAIDNVGETKSDLEIINLLAERFEKQNGWSSTIECYNEMIAPVGLEFAELREKNWMYPDVQYKRYEKGLLRPDGQPGFNTPTGKVELFSTVMNMVGVHPVPYFEEPYKSPVSTPELYKEYPFVMMSGVRTFYFHSEGRQIKQQREILPDPTAEMHPDAAAKLGIIDGDWIWIENDKDRVVQKVKLTVGIHPKMVLADHGWWFPEGDPESEYGAFAWEKSNINRLLDLDHCGETGYGADVRCSLCKVYKAKEGEY
jgi:anaerobic selenocysteine-containing dehydrogenase